MPTSWDPISNFVWRLHTWSHCHCRPCWQVVGHLNIPVWNPSQRLHFVLKSQWLVILSVLDLWVSIKAAIDSIIYFGLIFISGKKRPFPSKLGRKASLTFLRLAERKSRRQTCAHFVFSPLIFGDSCPRCRRLSFPFFLCHRGRQRKSCRLKVLVI